MVIHRKLTPEQAERRRVEKASLSAALVVFRKLAESGDLDGATINAHAPLFGVWDENEVLAGGSIRRCPESQGLYRYTVAAPIAPMGKAGDTLTAETLTLTQFEQQGLKGKSKPKPPSKNPDYWEQII